jgi:hypothetical protein
MNNGTPEYRRSYGAGWRYSQTANANLDYADATGRSANQAWMDGYMDGAAGREKWHLLHCPDHDACG